MKEIKMYESFDGKQFWTKKECEEYEAKHIPEIKVEGIRWYDENLNPLRLNLDNWDKVKFLKVENRRADIDFYEKFCKVLNSIDIKPDIKFDNYIDIDIWKKTLLVWDKCNEQWSCFEDILHYFEQNISRTFETYKTLIENCRKIIN